MFINVLIYNRNMNKQVTNVSISTHTIIKVIAIFLILLFLYFVRDILAILFISIVLSSAIDPWVDWMQKKEIPRSLGILFIYSFIIIIISITIYLIVPPIVFQMNELATNLPEHIR